MFKNLLLIQINGKDNVCYSNTRTYKSTLMQEFSTKQPLKVLKIGIYGIFLWLNACYIKYISYLCCVLL
nr:MAG TPA: hypothetical protein [Caudoviricetes sp.]